MSALARNSGGRARPEATARPQQPSLRRLRDFDIRPKRELGQNFLIDDNLLAVIGTAAELSQDDVVLEVGGGLGVLSEYVAPRVRHLHVIEVDRSLAAPLEQALEPFRHATLHLADATRLDLAALSPEPTKVVGNLPYGVAATVVLRMVRELAHATLMVAMVQREVADRLAAAPGSRIYGATSVLAQLACEVQMLRPVARTVFHPAPNVDSALILLRRTAPPPPAAIVALVHAAFAHRRKALAGSLSLGRGASGDLRDDARTALTCLGLPADARAERLSPVEFARLADELGPDRLLAIARR